MRTKVFISYSHVDRDWVDRLTLHLAVLERQGLLDVWSDIRIEVGAGWEPEIESALTDARVAVLLVSPAYLASTYVWAHEMPRIVAHQKAGMRVLPMVARPCAWRLEGELARLQARPTDGRALSTGADAQIDLDLAAFAYELAGTVGVTPNSVAVEERERMTSRTVVPQAQTEAMTREEPQQAFLRQGAAPLASTWRGRYPATNLEMTLRLDRQVGGEFTGIIEYDHGGATTVVGAVHPDSQPLRDELIWRELSDWSDLAVTFRERRVIREGRQPMSLDGEYRAFVDGSRMSGGWFSGGRLLGTFSFLAEPDVATAG